MRLLKKFSIYCCLLSSLWLISPLTLAWHLVESQDGIFIYSRAVAESPYLEYKLETNLNSPIEKVAGLLGDGSQCPAWYHRCKVMYIIKDIDNDNKIIYVKLNFPWPLSDRYAYIQSKRIQPAENIIEFNNKSIDKNAFKKNESKHRNANYGNVSHRSFT